MLDPADLLAQTIDDYTAWLAGWGRAVLYHQSAAQQPAILLTGGAAPPASFAAWLIAAARTQDQPALDTISVQYDHLHRLARIEALKAEAGETVTLGNYEAVVAAYLDLIAALRRFEKALAHAAARLDPLTGLRSRSGLTEDLTRDIARFARTRQPFCLAMMDIDHFKQINDHHGHDAGDRVLAAVADHIGGGLRPFDDVWRWGGEEFLICVKDADGDAGLQVIERLRQSLAATPLRLPDGNSLHVTASFGLATVADGQTVDSLLALADRALYLAKHNGRNRVETLPADMVL